ncbi:MAG: hypothetical protein ACFB6R_05835 [Alphaproteobacteria bacterium]
MGAVVAVEAGRLAPNIALACLFFLIPLGLDLVQQTTTAAGAPAFAFEGDVSMPADPLARFVTWSNTPQILRSANRIRDNPTFRYDYGGFRVARTLSPPSP